jgi:hypothetical protein
MGRAYLLITVPAVIVGIFYLAIFHGMGLQVHPAPFLGALGGFVAALLLVRHFQRRKVKRSGG